MSRFIEDGVGLRVTQIEDRCRAFGISKLEGVVVPKDLERLKNKNYVFKRGVRKIGGGYITSDDLR